MELWDRASLSWNIAAASTDATQDGGGGVNTWDDTDILLHNETGLPIHIAKDPVACVALGSGKALQELSLLRKVAVEG